MARAAAASAPTVTAGAPEQEAPQGRVSVAYGVSVRPSTQGGGSTTPVSMVGVSPSTLRLQAIYFFGRTPVGVAADLAGDWYVARQRDCVGTCEPLPLTGVRLWGGVAGRWLPTPSLAGELVLGYGYGAVPTIVADASGAAASAVVHHGPYASLSVGYTANELFEARARVRVMPYALGASVSPVGAVQFFQLGVGAELAAGGLQLGGSRWAVVADYEYELSRASGAYPLTNNTHRIGLGVRMALIGPPKRANDLRMEGSAGPAVIRGRVLLGAGEGVRPSVGIEVRLDGVAAARTDEQGAFRLEVPTPGPVEISVPARDGFKPASQQLVAMAGAEVEVELRPAPPSGPGSIRGTVSSNVNGTKSPLPGAEISWGGAASAHSGDDGSFVVAGVGPGPVSLSVKASGYQPQVEVVSVPAEAEAQIELTLLPVKQRVPAVIRGLIRTSGGRPVQAWVEVVEAKVRQRAGANGSFFISVPGGTYSVTITAEGFLPQTHSVQVADGEHSIFHVDLRPARD